MSRIKCNEIEIDYYLFRHFLNYFYGKSNWLFCIFACKSCQASVVRLVLREVGTSPDFSLGIDPGCPMGSRCWQSKERRKWGWGAFSSPGSPAYLLSGIQQGSEVPAVGEPLTIMTF